MLSFLVSLFPRTVKLPWIFLGAPLTFNGAPGNIQGSLAKYCSLHLRKAIIHIATKLNQPHTVHILGFTASMFTELKYFVVMCLYKVNIFYVHICV